MVLTTTILSALLAFASSDLVQAHPAPHTHATRSALPSSWFHERDHPVHDLFKRSNLHKRQDDGSDPDVGTPAWSAQYPQGSVDPSRLPAAWTDALNAAVAAGTVPNIPPSRVNGGTPAYPAGVNRNDPSVCAATDRVCRIPGNIWDAPEGVCAIGFDDGPTPASSQLYDYLKAQNQTATHYFIGTNILNNPTQFVQCHDGIGCDVAVHTWTHPYMTSLSNVAVLGELAMTMQIIHDSTGGRIPRFWRPPYGDIDTRVSAIASEVLGMTAVLWNQDTDDYNIPNGAQTFAKVNASMIQWLNGPKTPGLIILEHELYPQTVQVFMEHYPMMKSTGWDVVSQAQMFDDDWFQNGTAQAPNVTNAVFPVSTAVSTTSSSSSQSSSGTTSAQSGNATGGAAQGNSNDANSLKLSSVGPVLALASALLLASL